MAEKIGVNVRSVINLLAKNLYTTRDVAIRELLQNAYDSIRMRHNSKTSIAGRIDIVASRDAFRLEVSDNGTGMGEKGLREHLATLGQGIKQLNEALATRPHDGSRSIRPIGEYGIGFFSAFMIASRIVVTTRENGSKSTYVWSCDGLDEYEIEVVEDPSIPVGTRVELCLQRGAREYVSEAKIAEVVQDYCNYLDCPIHLNHSSDKLNVMQFPWELKEPGLQHQWLSRHLGNDPKLIFVGKIAKSGVRYHYSLSITTSSEGHHEIFCQRMHVTRRLSFLPTYLNFVDVILNCDQLTLDLSRESIQQGPTFETVKRTLETTIQEWLNKLLRNRDDVKELVTVIRRRQELFRELALKDRSIFDRIYSYLLFASAHSKEHTTVSAAIWEDPSGDNHLLYVSSIENKGALGLDRERFALLVCAERHIPVVRITSDEDEELLRRATTKMGVKRSRLSDAYEILPECGTRRSKAVEVVRSTLERFAGTPVTASSFPPPSMPVAIFKNEIVVNERNRYVEQLGNVKISASRQRALYQSLHRVLYALDKTGADNQVFESVIGEVMESLLGWCQALETLESIDAEFRYLSDRWWTGPTAIREVKNTASLFQRDGIEYRYRCFVAYPFSPEYRDVKNVILDVAKDHQVYAETAEEIDSRAILEKVCSLIDGCNFAVVDVSESNPNVLLELGLLLARRKPAILIRNASTSADGSGRAEIPADILGIERIDYSNTTEDLKQKLAMVFEDIAS